MIVIKLDAVARTLARKYSCPIYLVGSALNTDTPRDVDILAIMPDDEFAKRYGSVKEWVQQGETGDWGEARWRWSRECTRQTKQLWRVTDMKIDFQIQPESYANSYKAPKLLLAERRGRNHEL
ncbi:hypothetical protein [Gelria sp. Kuro-4]|uniref:hypothetical protein n=1 Tax=Gelria sp. Kuro-4 TaxID=2796927 RepID=UPI001C803A53|nr:hypothetical protein [Gelria sp. Kuro-4]